MQQWGMKTKPLIAYERTPSEVIAKILNVDTFLLKTNEVYQSIIGVVEAREKAKEDWPNLRVDPALQKVMSRVFSECKRNGFFYPHISISKGKKGLAWNQMVESRQLKKSKHVINHDLCSCCERICHRGEKEKQCWR